MITLKKIYTLLFFLGVFFIPFNDFEGFQFGGEFSHESTLFFFLPGFGLVVLDWFYKKKISFPYRHPLIILLVTFLFWTFLATLVNLPTILENFYKQTSGISRYIRQTISLLICAVCFTVLFWNALKDYTLTQAFIKVRKVIFYGFVFVSVYAFFEIAIVFFKMTFLRPIWDLFEYFPFVNNHLNLGGGRIGISSVSYEIPALGDYLLFVFPWLLSYIFTEKSFLKFVPSVVAIVLILFSDARAGFVIMTIQLVVFVLLLLHDVRFRKKTAFALQFATVIIGILVLANSEKFFLSVDKKLDKINFSKNLTTNISNKSRFGMQYAALQVFKENPVCGVGYGQGHYQMRFHYPYWATANNYEFDLYYKNVQVKSFPPQYNAYTRLLAETGIVGALLFLGLIVLCVYYALMYWKKTSYNNNYQGVIFLLSFIGFAINWVQMDFFRQYGFWLMLILLIKALYEFNGRRQVINNQNVDCVLSSD